MNLPDFSSLWNASKTLRMLEKSLKGVNACRARGRGGNRGGRKRPIDTYYSDGICGVSFGIEKPEFSNPLKTCCDQHFFTEKEFKRHESEHIKCTFAPCDIVIHPSMMNFHIETAHSDDLRSRMKASLDGADRIVNNWRDSRKRNYPTFERVQAKIRETGYRIDRGQVLMTRQFGLLNSRKPRELKKKSPHLQRNPLDKNSPTEEPSGVICPDETTKNDQTTISTADPSFLDISSFQTPLPVTAKNVQIECSDTADVSKTEKQIINSLVSCSYDSDASLSDHPLDNKFSVNKRLQQTSEDDTNMFAKLSSTSQLTIEMSNAGLNTDRPLGRRRRQRRRPNRREVLLEKADAPFASHPVVRLASKRRECMRDSALISKRPTLLHMLLAEDMRHERNQLMQCVRFVARNKFFM